MTARGTISLTRRIAAAPDVVFSYLVEAERLARWLGRSCTLDPRPGGAFVMHSPNGLTARGEVVEVVAGRKLSFTWGWEGNPGLPPGGSLVSIEVTAAGDGSLVTLTHTGLPADLTDLHRTGWTHYLARLAAAGEGGDPGPDRGAG